jgi:glycosyltransferase involved in cell wall biosynthesis
MDKPKIAVIGLKGLPAFGGAAAVGENIIGQLKDYYSFTVYSVASHTNKKGLYNGYYQIVFKTFPVKTLNILFYYIKSMFHCLFKGNYDLIHLNHIDGAFILPFLRLKYRVISTSHGKTHVMGKWPSYMNFYFRINEYLLLRLSNIVTSVGKPLAELYQKSGYKNIYYIPNGINMNQSISSDPLAYKDYILFAAGRIIPMKGCHVMLEALKKIDYNGKVLIIGDLNQIPSYKEKLLALAKGINVVFIPLIKNKDILLNYVKNARLFIFPSGYENMSMMLLEAAFTKTPLICSDIPENTSVFSENEVTFFRAGNVSDLSEKIIFALNNPDKTGVLKNNAFKLLSEQYNWHKIAGLYDALYRKLLA